MGAAIFQGVMAAIIVSFVVLAALLIHRGSAESRDSNDRMEEALKRIENRLDALKR